MRARRWVVSALAVLATAGCASISESRRILERPVGGRSDAGVEQIAQPVMQVETINANVILLELYVEAVCYEAEYATLERRQVITRHSSDALKWEWAGAATGLVVGIPLIVAAPTLSDEPTYDETTGEPAGSHQDTARVAGYTSLAAGAVVLVIAIVDSVRAADSVEPLPEVERLTRRRTFPCERVTMAHRTVSARLGSRPIELGTTDAFGRLRVDLDDVVPRRAVTGPAPATSFWVRVDGEPFGSVSLEPYRQHLESEAWQEASAAASVPGWQLYVDEFPTSGRIAQAQQTLRHIELQERNAEVAEAWETAVSANTIDALLSFIAHYPETERAGRARLEILAQLVDDERFTQAEELLGEWTAVDPVLAAHQAEVRDVISESRRDARERDRRRAVEAVNRAIGGCQAGGCSGDNPRCAAEAYTIVDEAEGLLGSERFNDLETRVLARCGCTRSAARP